MTKDRRHYAVLDPDDATRMTYWRESETGLRPWPAKARYGPVLATSDLPEDQTALLEFVDQHLAREDDWRRRVREAIEADPVAAGRRFAEFTTRCCWCGRTLTDVRSKVYGIGPDCRAGIPAEVLAAYYTPQVARAHADGLLISGGQAVHNKQSTTS